MRREDVPRWLSAGAVARKHVVPVADHHQHLFSPAISDLLQGGVTPITADDVVALLDAAGIQRAVLLSVAYMYGSPARSVADEYARVRAENDWTATEAARHPDRLRAFGSVNPLRDYAVDEVVRWAHDPRLRHGLKLHFGNSDVQLDRPPHVAQLRRVFATANEHGLAIVVHLRPSIAKRRPYGAAQARVFLEQLLPLAPDVPVQVAHLAASGPGYDDPAAREAMSVLAGAIKRADPRTDRLWFDVATVVDRAISPSTASHVADRIRQVGIQRVLYGSDAAVGDNLRPRDGWEAFRCLPLQADEIASVAANVAPYLR